MNKIFNLTSTFKTLGTEEDGSVTIRGMASTNSIDRAGDAIDAEAWTKGGLMNFENNPIILFNHDYDRPIGRAKSVRITENGLELEAKISKSAPANVCELVKEGILGAFSVGFRVKDAEHIQETGGLRIKDAELFEVSVVSVPCNQAATFSLAKSFDSETEYEEFKKTFNNSVDLAGQSLAKHEDNSSNIASDAPDEDSNESQQEKKMSEENNTPKFDLDAVAKKAAEEAVAKMAMAQAQEKATAKAEAEKVAAEVAAKTHQEEEVTRVITSGIQSGTEKLMSDMAEKMSAKEADHAKIIAENATILAEKEAELTKMREARGGIFGERSSPLADRVKNAGVELKQSHLLGVITGKGFNTDFARDVFEKAGLDYATDAGDIDQEVSRQIEEEIKLELRTAALFKEMPVSGHATVMPLQSDTGFAKWTGTGADTTTNDGSGDGATNRTANDTYTSNTYNAKQKILTVDRLISSTYMDNVIDEKVLVNLMPMLTAAVARSHARAVDKAIIQGNGSNIAGLGGLSTAGAAWGAQETDTAFTAQVLVKCRRNMGVYGLSPQDVVYIVSQDKYYDLLEDPDFENVNEVGSDLALKRVGQVGAVYGSPVVLSDNFLADAEDGVGGAFAVNVNNFVIPRLRGVTVEQEYQVEEQRRVLVATQHLGFDEMFAAVAGKSAATHAVFNNAA